MSALFSNFYKTVTASGTPEAIGAASIEFNSAIVTARKSDAVANMGKVWIGSNSGDATNAEELWPGNSVQLIAPMNGILNAGQYWLDVQTGGDGVLFSYILADWKAFNDIESKVEEAVWKYIRTIGATLDDCSITRGITDEERTADNIHCHCPRAEEGPVPHINLWNCSVEVIVESNVSRDDKLNKHRLRTAYVRDLLMDEAAEETLSALVPGFSVHYGSIHNLSVEQTVLERKWRSVLAFQIIACGSDLV